MFLTQKVKIMKTFGEKGQEIFLFSKTTRRAGAHPASQFNGYWCSSLGIKWQERDIYHSFLSGAKVKNEWRYAITPLYTFMVWTGTLPTCYFTVSVWEVNKY
jgi:hypothetical protein